MHRLLQLGGVGARLCPRVPFNNLSENVDSNISGKACILCKHLSRSGMYNPHFKYSLLTIYIEGNLRNQSTVTHPNLQHKRRKKKRNKKMFADLLVGK